MSNPGSAPPDWIARGRGQEFKREWIERQTPEIRYVEEMLEKLKKGLPCKVDLPYSIVKLGC